MCPRSSGALPDDFDRIVDTRLGAWIEALGNDKAALVRRIGQDLGSKRLVELLADDDRPPTSMSPAPWTKLIERVLRVNANRPALQLQPFAEQLPFGSVLLPFLQTADDVLRETEQAIPSRKRLSDSAFDDLLRGLGWDLVDILGNPLLAAFDRVRPMDPVLMARLVGVTGAEQRDHYERFVQDLARGGLEDFLCEYAVAARLAGTTLRNWISSTCALLARLDRDADEIAGMMGEINGAFRIDRIDPRLSEPHDGGQRVVALTSTSGNRVIYKPRPMGGEAVWGEVLRKVPLDLAQQLPSVLERKAYGWMSWVSYQDCDDPTAIARFFRRSGALLGAAFVLGAKDLHYENVIAAGEHPVLVDLETLIQPDPKVYGRPDGLIMRSQVAREVSFLRSVIRAEYLPRGQAPSEGDSFVGSALATPSEGALRAFTWVGQNTDVMHLAQGSNAAPMANLPALDGQSIHPGEHAAAFVEGFEQAEEVLWAHQQSVETALSARQDLRFRCIFRATRTYYSVRHVAYLAKNLRSGIDFGIALEHLWRAVDGPDMPKKLAAIVRAEIAAMTEGDIPRFSAVAGAYDLDGGINPSVVQQFEQTGIDHVRANLNATGAQDWHRNQGIVTAVLNALPGATTQAPPKAEEPLRAFTTSEFLAEASAIGSQICDSAWPMDTGVYWTGLVYRLPNSGFQCDPLNDSLYEGNTGIGLFLAALSYATGNATYRDYAYKAFAPLRGFLKSGPSGEEVHTEFGLGLAGGIGGIAAGWALAGRFLADDTLIDDAHWLLLSMPSYCPNNSDETDLLLGTSGGIIGAAAVYSVRREDRLLELIGKCADHLIAQDALNSDTGATMAHGAGGPAYALATAHRLCGNPQYLEVARSRFFKALDRSNQDAHCDTHHGTVHSGWCWGQAGKLVAAMAMEPAGEAEMTRRLARQLADSAAAPLDQLCCGSFGVVDSLLEAGTLLEDAYLIKGSGTLAAEVVQRARKCGGYALLSGVGRGYWGPSLFQGAAGIGYGLLRLTDPKGIPALVALGHR